MTKKLRVLVDMDDTICHLVQRCIYHHNNKYPDHPMKYEDVTSWDMENIWHPECTPEDFFGRPGLYEELEFLDEHVVEEMRKLHEAYEVIIVTAASAYSVLEKWKWMQKHLPFIPHENFITAKKKYLIDGHLLIDDGSHNLIPWTELGRPAIGIPHPWNAEVRNKVHFKYDGWKDMKIHVDEIFMSLGYMPRPA